MTISSSSGFSRGAYTARSLAGMIAFFGVPNKNLDNQTVREIFCAYRLADHAQRLAAKADLTAEYALSDVRVRMVGVWDTVGALGIPGHLFGIFDQAKHGFLDTALNPCIQNAYHAVAIDERRASFLPTLWTNPDGTPRANDATTPTGVVSRRALRCRWQLHRKPAFQHYTQMDG